MEGISVLNDALRWNSLQRRIQEHNIQNALDIFRANGIEPIIFKGWAAARYYPLDKPRTIGDIDLAVSSEDYPRALALLNRDDVRKLNIDLHKEFRHLDTVDWAHVFSNSTLLQIDRTEIRVPADEDHLRLLSVHWLTDGGANRERLWDIYYLIANRPANFDWSRCLDVVSPQRRRWITCTIGLAHQVLGLNLSELPLPKKSTNVPGWVTRCVEREWKRGGNIEPVLTSIYNWGIFADQLKRRFPPNPLRAVVEAEGSIDRTFRFDYQLRVLARRSLPFLRDLGDYVKRRFKGD